MFVQNTGRPRRPAADGAEYCPPGIVMDYYDGNTVTALWNYAQNYAMSDNDWDTTFGPSTPGALNVISGDTGGATALTPTWVVQPEPASRPRAPSAAARCSATSTRTTTPARTAATPPPARSA